MAVKTEGDTDVHADDQLLGTSARAEVAQGPIIIAREAQGDAGAAPNIPNGGTPVHSAHIRLSPKQLQDLKTRSKRPDKVSNSHSHARTHMCTHTRAHAHKPFRSTRIL